MEARNEIRQYRINSENYLKLGKAWIEAKGGFVMGLIEGECQGVRFPQAPRQWGAWRAYLKERGIKTTFMDARAKATAESKAVVNTVCWTVPTEWPHEFDSEATVQGDHAAGNLFMRNWRPPNPVYADAAQRAITALKYKRWSETVRKPVKPDVEPEEAPSIIDKAQLLADYEKDISDYYAKHGKRIG